MLRVRNETVHKHNLAHVRSGAIFVYPVLTGGGLGKSSFHLSHSPCSREVGVPEFLRADVARRIYQKLEKTDPWTYIRALFGFRTVSRPLVDHTVEGDSDDPPKGYDISNSPT